MRNVMRVFVGVMLASGLAVSVTQAGVRGQRGVKGSSLGFHLASDTPQAGFRQMTTSSGEVVYVAPRASWTSLDVLSVDTLPSRDGSTLSVRLSGEATKRLSSRARQNGDTKVAIFAGTDLLSAAAVDAGGGLTVEGISPDQADRISRLVNNEPSTPAGPVVTVVSAGQANGQQLVDVYVQGVDELRSYQVTLRTGGGESGRLELQSVTIDEARDDYVFGGSQIIAATSPLMSRLAAVRFDGATTAVRPSYLGTYAFTATPDASGMFRVNVELGRESILAGGNNEPMDFSVGADARIWLATNKGSTDGK